MKTNKKGLPLIAIGILLVIIALAITGYNYIESYHAGKMSSSVTAQLDKQITATDDGFAINKNMEMPIVKIGDNEYIGNLEIPSLKLDLPVMNSWNYANLKISPCRYTGTVYKKNMVICAHNYYTHFGRLRSLSIGDEVKFTDADGNEFTYEVKELEILQPTDIDDMKNSIWDLTLFTCTIGGKTRVTVRCQMVSSSAKII